MLCLEYYTFHPAHVQVKYISREAETEEPPRPPPQLQNDRRCEEENLAPGLDT